MSDETFTLLYYDDYMHGRHWWALTFTLEFEEEYKRTTGLSIDDPIHDCRTNPYSMELLESRGSLWVCGAPGLKYMTLPVDLKNYWSIVLTEGKERVIFNYDKMIADILDGYLDHKINASQLGGKYQRVKQLSIDFPNQIQIQDPDTRVIELAGGPYDSETGELLQLSAEDLMSLRGLNMY
jgi:hypothetical protein